ncbi:MAG: acetylornithine/succinyldiaminopimelate transaminase [Proteobacteria bacterium]|nr:acetylornithine/succinyldiaminopimelate transaminase [Pseudomonadota bacterium]MCL2308494.1 acetylornithine/succinyldiaminopimelate transaminase [Pseudomonadota bacterium]
MSKILPVSRALFDEIMMPCASPAPFIPVRGSGARVWDQEDRMYIDFAAGVATNALGHCHPAMTAALQAQSKKLWHVSPWLTNEPALRLARRLVENTFAERVFFCNSGAEANEAALKLARRYANDTAGSHKMQIISTVNAFHGRTLFTVTASGQPKYSSGFGPVPEGITHVPYNDVAALQAAFDQHGDNVCAMILEPIQGESGVVPATEEFLHMARHLCMWHKALLILDEVQTGMGRTGVLFSYMNSGVTPDILTSAKGLGGGFPIGAMLTTHEIARVFAPGVHGTTFGGNPLACAVGEAVFDVINTPQLLEGVRIRHRLFMAGLKAIQQRVPFCKLIRGEGLLLGCVLDERLQGRSLDVINAAGKAGLLVLAAGPDVVRLVPPLTIAEEDIREGMARLEKALSILS